MVLCRLPVCRERSRCAQNPPPHRKEPVILRGRARDGLDCSSPGKRGYYKRSGSRRIEMSIPVTLSMSSRADSLLSKGIQGAEMRLKCRLHLEMFAVPIYATCRRLGVPNIAHLMSCGAAKKATDTRCHLPYMFRCNAIALDRIRVSQSRAIDPSWAQSSLGSSRFYRLWHLPPSLVSLPLYLKTPLCGGTP